MSEGILKRRAPTLGNPGRREQLNVIEPPRRWPGLGLREFARLRTICWVLTRRNLMVRYRQTLIGAAWSLLQPILLMIIFTIFFGLLARTPSGGLPFPIFFFVGLVPWQMASKILTEGSTSVVSNASLVTRVYFPRAYFPTAVALAALVDLVLGLAAMTVLLLWFHIVPGPEVVFAPVLVLVAWISSLGLALFLSALNVEFRDIAQLLPFLAQLWMFLSPIIYSSSLIPESVRPLYYLNPMALVVDGFRWSIANAPAPPAYAWVIGSIVSVVMLVGGYVVFRKREPAFADIV